MENKKKEPWRIILGTVSIVIIVFLWVKKDIVGIIATTSGEEVLPLIVTTVAVTLVKVGLITGGILLIKWIIGKFKK